MPPRPTPPPASKPRRRPGPPVSGAWLWIAIGIALIAMFFYRDYSDSAEIPYSDFLKIVSDKKQAKNIEKIVFVTTDRVQLEIKDPAALPDDLTTKNIKERSIKRFMTKRWPLDDPDLSKQLDALLKENPALRIDVPEDHFAWLGNAFLFIILPALIIFGLFFLLLPRIRDPLSGGGGFLNSYVKSPARRYDRNKMRVTFEDVAGMHNAKSELQEIVEFLKAPEKFQRLGAQVPKGVLLVGPPGTGKTLLARAVAGEAGVPFFSINGSEFIQMFVGVGASRVRDLFKNAKDSAPCILFIDEIDAVGRMRGAGVGGGSDEREQTLNQILSEMDGFTPTETVIVMAATNRPDVLDAALLRPGRFDRHVTIDRPTWQGRLAILKVHTRNKPLADDVDLEALARTSIGMTGADLRNLANEAALLATREGKNKIDRHDFARAVDRVLMGPKREEVLTAEGKRKTAYHEAGHTLVSWLEPASDPPQKVSIVPRGKALGVTFNTPDEERYHHGMDYWTARLAVIMGGRAADRLVFNQAFSGHEDDLRQATRLARYMVTHWGMSDRLGPMSFRVGEEHVFLGKEIQEPRDFSDASAAVIDEEVQKLLRAADLHAFDLLQTNRDKLDRLVEALLQREELLRDEIDMVLRGEPLPPQTPIEPPTPAAETPSAERNLDPVSGQGEPSGIRT